MSGRRHGSPVSCIPCVEATSGMIILWKRLLLILLVALICGLLTGATPGDSDVTHLKIWVYFTDHGESSPEDLAAAIESVQLSERSLERRRVRGAGAVRDIHDLPVHGEYLDRLRDEGCTLKKPSKYLNAVSVIATPEQITTIRMLPFVKKVEPVRRYRRSAPDVRFEEQSRAGGPHSTDAPATPAMLDYGPSFNQVNQINVVSLHDAGYHGEGIMIGVFDTGFMLRHEAFQHLDVEAEWDFIFDDGNTENEPGDLSASQHDHGTRTLSTMAGFAEGKLIGTAYAATYVLAKTERMFEEVVGEEDDFVRALEWVDSIGVDIVSASLGYFRFDNAADNYTFADLDGNTAITTVACDIAVGKGITVCTAAGNERTTSWGHIIAPSDGDSVIAVGAVDAAGQLSSFSSPGPSADGRIKPDIAAMGTRVTTAVSSDSTGYTSYSSGTSFSTPIAGGAIALILQWVDENTVLSWGPMDVLQALRTEASQSDSPDNDLGWGIIDAYQSALRSDSAVGITDAISMDISLTGNVVRGSVFNGNSTTQTVNVLRQKLRSGGSYEDAVTVAPGVVVAGSSSSAFEDRLQEGGVYEYSLRLPDNPDFVFGETTVTFQYGITLDQSAPNPFSAASGAETTIRYSIGGVPAAPGQPAPIGTYSDVRLEIFDVRGARVATLVDGIQSPGEYTVGWSGMSDTGNAVASGVYFYRLETPGQVLTRKMVLVRP